MSLSVVPIKQKAALDVVAQLHRHNKPPRGDVIRLAVENDGEIVAVGIAGYPVARRLNDGLTLEITRVATDGARNACSLIYGRLRRAAFALGFTRVITYTRADESGSSLRAAGFRMVATIPPSPGWDRPGRSRENADYDSIKRLRWESIA